MFSPKFGIDCKTQDLIARKVNVYDIVQRTADKFGYKVPEIIVSNTLLPNAAASGPYTKSRHSFDYNGNVSCSLMMKKLNLSWDMSSGI